MPPSLCAGRFVAWSPPFVLGGFREGPRGLSHVPSLRLVGFGEGPKGLSHVPFRVW